MAKDKDDIIFHAEGTLVLKNNLKEYDWGIYNRKKVSSQSITTFLKEEIYSSEFPYVKMFLQNLNKKETIKKTGELCLMQNELGIYDWVIKGKGKKNNLFYLGNKLFDWGEQEIVVHIKQEMVKGNYE